MTMALMAHDKYSKQELEAMEKSLVREPGDENLKVFLKKQDDLKDAYTATKKMHDRVKEVNKFILKRNKGEMGPAGNDLIDTTGLFLNEMCEKVKPKDFAKVITLIEMYNRGDFNEAFAQMETKIKENDNELRETNPTPVGEGENAGTTPNPSVQGESTS